MAGFSSIFIHFPRCYLKNPMMDVAKFQNLLFRYCLIILINYVQLNSTRLFYYFLLFFIHFSSCYLRIPMMDVAKFPLLIFDVDDAWAKV